MHSRGAGPDKGTSKTSKVQALLSLPKGKGSRVEDFTILKQACPSEYQEAQGAFKDSMIH